MQEGSPTPLQGVPPGVLSGLIERSRSTPFAEPQGVPPCLTIRLTSVALLLRLRRFGRWGGGLLGRLRRGLE